MKFLPHQMRRYYSKMSSKLCLPRSNEYHNVFLHKKKNLDVFLMDVVDMSKDDDVERFR